MRRPTDAKSAMFEQQRPRLKAISCRIVGSEAEAEDIVQDCFLKWHDTEQSVLTTPAAWLTTVVQNQSIDHLRTRARDAAAARTAMELVPDVPPAAPVDDLLRRAEVGEALARLLACLSPSERLALVLHEVLECKHADIAVALGTKTVNTRQNLTRARRRLRESNGVPSPEEKLCRELIRRFQSALSGRDVSAMITLLADEQPLFMHESPQLRISTDACANDVSYRLAVAA